MLNRLVCMFFLTIETLCVQAQPTYPIVSKSEQQARDDDRRPLLESELAFEQQALEKAKNEFATDATDDRTGAIHLHQENIEALKRELGNIGPQRALARHEHPVVKAVRDTAHVIDSKRTPNFWDPYNRTPDPIDFPTSPTRNSHE